MGFINGIPTDSDGGLDTKFRMTDNTDPTKALTFTLDDIPHTTTVDLRIPSTGGTVATREYIGTAAPITKLEAIVTDRAEPHGIVGTPTVTYQGTRTIRIAHPFSYYYHGVKVSSTANVDVQCANTTGLYLIKFTNASLTASASTTLDSLNEVTFAGFYWNATTSDYMFFEEAHGITWSANLRRQAHATKGSQYQSGGAISGYVLGSDTLENIQIALDQVNFWDEDLLHNEAARLKTENWDKWYLGTGGYWLKDAADNIPCFHSSNIPRINTFSTPNWSLTAVTANNYFNCYVFATNSAEAANRYILIPGQGQSTTLSGAQALSITNLVLGVLPLAELLPLYQLTFRYRTTNTNNAARVTLAAVLDIRRVISPSVSVGISANHNSLAGRSDVDCHPSSAISGPLGLLTEAKTASFTAVTGKHYLVDFAGAPNTDITVVMPAGAALSVLRFSTNNGNPAGTGRLLFTPISGEKFQTNGTLGAADEQAKMLAPNGYCQMAWDTGLNSAAGAWLIDDPSVFVTGTFAGSLNITGGLSIGTGQTITKNIAPTQQIFTTGTGTYTTPAGVLWARVRMVGGGGGGGGSGSDSTGTGGTGGNTTFGTTLLAANGGVGGGGAIGNPSGAGGSASLGSGPIGIALSGGKGGFGNLAVNFSGGAGGYSPFGGAGEGGDNGAAGVSAIANTGSGGQGGGGAALAYPGAGGGAGGFIDAIISSPTTSYSYAIGSAGTAGSAGTNGYVGGAGGSGVIIVEEHYI